MILIDFNQIALSNIFIQKLNDENMIRHMILNSIRMYNKKYRDEYGQMVICCDGMNTWRRDYFPEYKANRKKTRDKDSKDWNQIFDCISIIREELKVNFPYKYICISKCEADDIIGILCSEYSDEILILSGDKDFIQLQKYPNVKQYSPITKKMVTGENPDTYLKEHVFKYNLA